MEPHYKYFWERAGKGLRLTIKATFDIRINSQIPAEQRKTRYGHEQKHAQSTIDELNKLASTLKTLSIDQIEKEIDGDIEKIFVKEAAHQNPGSPAATQPVDPVDEVFPKPS